MLRVGITGGIGSGKTTVCQIFEALGIPVYYADARAKWLTTHDLELKAGIRALFGDEAYTPEGAYNRAYVAGIVFSQPDTLKQLNALIHPAVAQDSLQWHIAQQPKGVPYTLYEAALMIESGNYRALDAIIVVTAPEDLRIQRVMKRDAVTEEQVRARMQYQLTEEQKMACAHYMIHNDGHHLLLPQVWEIHTQITCRRPSFSA